MVALAFIALDAYASAIPWLPVDAVITPFFSCYFDTLFKWLVTPRNLNAPQYWASSCLTKQFALYFVERPLDLSRGVYPTIGLILLDALAIFAALTPLIIGLDFDIAFVVLLFVVAFFA